MVQLKYFERDSLALLYMYLITTMWIITPSHSVDVVLCKDFEVQILATLEDGSYIDEYNDLHYTVTCSVARIGKDCILENIYLVNDTVLTPEILHNGAPYSVNISKLLTQSNITEANNKLFMGLEATYEITKEPGEHSITCKLITQQDKQVLGQSASRNATFYKLPFNTSITGLPSNGAVTDNIYYDIGCTNVGGHPPSEYELRLKRGNIIYYRRKLLSLNAKIAIQFTRSHHGMIVECHDLTHSKHWDQKSRHATATLDVRFIDRAHDKKLPSITVFKGDNPSHQISCSEYLTWRGRLAIAWYHIPIQTTQYSDDMGIRYIPSLNWVTVVCAARLINVEHIETYYLSFNVTMVHKTRWRNRIKYILPVIIAIAAVLNVILILFLRGYYLQLKDESNATANVAHPSRRPSMSYRMYPSATQAIISPSTPPSEKKHIRSSKTDDKETQLEKSQSQLNRKERPDYIKRTSQVVHAKRWRLNGPSLVNKKSVSDELKRISTVERAAERTFKKRHPSAASVGEAILDQGNLSPGLKSRKFVKRSWHVLFSMINRMEAHNMKVSNNRRLTPTSKRASGISLPQPASPVKSVEYTHQLPSISSLATQPPDLWVVKSVDGTLKGSTVQGQYPRLRTKPHISHSSFI